MLIIKQFASWHTRPEWPERSESRVLYVWCWNGIWTPSKELYQLCFWGKIVRRRLSIGFRLVSCGSLCHQPRFFSNVPSSSAFFYLKMALRSATLRSCQCFHLPLHWNPMILPQIYVRKENNFREQQTTSNDVMGHAGLNEKHSLSWVTVLYLSFISNKVS